MAISLTGLALAESDLETQLALLVIWGAVWFFVIKYSSKYFFEPFINSKPWKDQWTELNGKTFKTALFIEFKTTEETFEFACLFLAIICQHALGGLLCVPSLLGGPKYFLSVLACHGGLCEAGWEFQDIILRAYQLLFGGEAGKAKNPTPLLVILAIHHAMGISMVIPMNMLYRDSLYYHEFIFLLQGAAFVACGSQNYGYTVDVKTASGLKQMKICVSITLAVMAWSRAFRYAFVGYKLILGFSASGHTKMLCGGGLVLGLMAILNLLFLSDAVGKFKKFIKMSHTDEDLQPTLVRMHSSLHRHSTTHFMTTSEKEWAKIRGAVRMGAFHKLDATKEEKKES